MKTLSIIKSLLLLAVVAFIATGCKKDDDKPTGGGGGGGGSDTEAPVVTRISPTNADITAAAGDDITITVRITDNVGLSEVRFNIHNAFDGHAHKTGTVTVDTLYYNEIYSMTGVTDTTIVYTFPTSTTNQPGDYHLGVYAIDAAGNNAETMRMNLELTNSLFPAQSATDPLAAEVPDDVTISGPANHLRFGTDNETDGTETGIRRLVGTVNAGAGQTLDEIEIVLRKGRGHGHSHKAAHGDDEVKVAEFGSADFTSASSHDFGTGLDMNFLAVSGELEAQEDYDLIIEVKDTEGRKSEFKVATYGVRKTADFVPPTPAKR